MHQRILIKVCIIIRVCIFEINYQLPRIVLERILTNCDNLPQNQDTGVSCHVRICHYALQPKINSKTIMNYKTIHKAKMLNNRQISEHLFGQNTN